MQINITVDLVLDMASPSFAEAAKVETDGATIKTQRLALGKGAFGATRMQFHGT